MAGENRGLYVYIGGVLVPAATIKGSKGDKGDPGVGTPGPAGTTAVGVVVKDEAPPNPIPWETVWMDVGGIANIPAWNEVGASGQPAFQNAWVNFAPTSTPMRFRREDDFSVTRLSGIVKSGTVNATIFILPSGYRPQYDISLPVISNSALARIVVTAAGAVSLATGGSNVSVDFGDTTFASVIS